MENQTAVTTERLAEPSVITGPQQIVVLDRGFVYVGTCSLEGRNQQWLRIRNCRNIRRWGTTRGLAELINGPTGDTILDETCEVIAPLRAVVHLIPCNRMW